MSKTGKNINFIGNRKTAFIVSGVLFAITLISLLIHKGPELSIDFTGGTSIIVPFEDDEAKGDADKIKDMINELNLGSDPEVKPFEGDGKVSMQIVLNTKDSNIDSTKNVIIAELKKKYGNKIKTKEITSETVGPKVGNELAQTTVWAIIWSLFAIVLYIGIRFKFGYGFAAIAALFHDVVITIGVFSVFGIEISLPIIAAILTIVGYSLNDTIVVFDRIRENLNEHNDSKKSLEDMINESINQTLSRTLITSLTTFVVVLAIFIKFWGTSNILFSFAGALIVGIISGTYSSIFIASPVLVMWNKKWPIR